jgi:hypothetical protein
MCLETCFWHIDRALVWNNLNIIIFYIGFILILLYLGLNTPFEGLKINLETLVSEQ